ncbi:MAG: hypothetical protein JWM57_2697 [Phycisphaerales bacterium]|nr:hypothetical protein [Phycisphaerales bacterium]
MRSVLLTSALSLFLAGCAVQNSTKSHGMANHPADPDACCGTVPAQGDKADMTMPAVLTPGATQPAMAAYVCPMHPEVTSDKPGACPKCGMALVPTAKGGHDGHH